MERAAVGLLREIAAGAGRYPAGEPEVEKADSAGGEGRHRKQDRDREEELTRLGHAPRLGQRVNPRLPPYPLRVC